MAIGRSRTGVYHRVIGGASNCNGRSFRGTGTVDISMIDKAPEKAFCKKCFGNSIKNSPKQQAKRMYNADAAHERAKRATTLRSNP